jgi:hypothetical protein
MLLVCVAAVALMQSLISTRGAWPVLHAPQLVPIRGTPAVGSSSIATGHDAIAAIAGSSSDFASDRSAAENQFRAGADDYDLIPSGHAE